MPLQLLTKMEKRKRKRKRTTGAVSDFFGGRFFMKNIFRKRLFYHTFLSIFKKIVKQERILLNYKITKKSPQLPII
jgi:hypothetical protein